MEYREEPLRSIAEILASPVWDEPTEPPAQSYFPPSDPVEIQQESAPQERAPEEPAIQQIAEESKVLGFRQLEIWIDCQWERQYGKLVFVIVLVAILGISGLAYIGGREVLSQVWKIRTSIVTKLNPPPADVIDLYFTTASPSARVQAVPGDAGRQEYVISSVNDSVFSANFSHADNKRSSKSLGGTLDAKTLPAICPGANVEFSIEVDGKKIGQGILSSGQPTQVLDWGTPASFKDVTLLLTVTGEPSCRNNVVLTWQNPHITTVSE